MLTTILVAVWTAVVSLGSSWLAQKWARRAALDQITAQQEHEDKHRFHLMRVDYYAAYQLAAGRVASHLLGNASGPRIDHDTAELIATFERARMVSSAAVTVQATTVHALLSTALATDRQTMTVANRIETWKKWLQENGKLITLMREDLGLAEEGERISIVTALQQVLDPDETQPEARAKR